MSDDLINPLVECPTGFCPHCGNQLLIIDSEMVYMELNNEGYPIDYEVTYSRVEGVCYSCGANIPYKRSFMKYVPYNPMFDKQLEKNIRANFSSKEENPFVK